MDRILCASMRNSQLIKGSSGRACRRCCQWPQSLNFNCSEKSLHCAAISFLMMTLSLKQPDWTENTRYWLTPVDVAPLQMLRIPPWFQRHARQADWQLVRASVPFMASVIKWWIFQRENTPAALHHPVTLSGGCADRKWMDVSWSSVSLSIIPGSLCVIVDTSDVILTLTRSQPTRLGNYLKLVVTISHIFEFLSYVHGDGSGKDFEGTVWGWLFHCAVGEKKLCSKAAQILSEQPSMLQSPFKRMLGN